MAQTLHLEALLKEHVTEGGLYTSLEDEKLVCYACAHRCKILPGQRGICRVRFNEGGKLFVPWGYVGALQVDPIEKKPFFHAYPGARAASFGMLGCDFHCGYCQNWVTSQTLRDPAAVSEVYSLTPEQFVELALRRQTRVITSTYNEPLITSEWAVEILKLGRPHGLAGAYVSNGNATREVLEYIHPWVDLYKVDLKTFQGKNYRELGGVLEHVLDTIKILVEMGFWVEVVTLTMPGFNDSEAEQRDIARFLFSVSPDIPWHITAFHPDYKMSDKGSTPARTLLRACEIGKEEGLRYVYAGNMPGALDDWENTRCYSCGCLLIERTGFHVHQNRLNHGCCPNCDVAIAGRWD